MKCARKGCGLDAVGALQINVPATGYPALPAHCAQVIIGIGLCEGHFHTAQAGEFFQADERLSQAVKAMTKGRTRPDFGRAFTSRVSFESKEWKILQRGGSGR